MTGPPPLALASMFRLAVLHLRLSPRDAWALTLPELALLLGADPAAAPPDRAILAALMARFPDDPQRSERPAA